LSYRTSQIAEEGTIRDPDLQLLIDEVQSLVGDPDWWDIGSLGLFGTLTNQLENRLKKWLLFFQNHYSKSVCMYPETAMAIFHAFGHWDAICKQDNESFRRSLQFYEDLLIGSKFVAITDFKAATHLLKVSLIAGNYHGQLLSRVRDEAQFLHGEVSHEMISQLFMKLFVKWETPQYFVYNLDDLDFYDVDMLMYHLSGKNIRTYPSLPYSLSKKESHVLINILPREIQFGDLYGLKALLAAKVLAVNVKGIGFLQDFLDCSENFFQAPQAYYDEIDWWKQLFGFITKESFLTVNEHSIPEIIDYCQYVRANTTGGFSVKGRTATSLNRKIRRWHEELDFEGTIIKKEKKWPSTYGTSTLSYKNEEWRLIELCSGEELLNESHVMQHCVFSYVDRCDAGLIQIFSLVKRNEENWEGVATAEFRSPKFSQVKGRMNIDVSDEVGWVLLQFEELLNEKERQSHLKSRQLESDN